MPSARASNGLLKPRWNLSCWDTAAKATVSVACSAHKSNGNGGSKKRLDKGDVSINANMAVSKGFLKCQ